MTIVLYTNIPDPVFDQININYKIKNILKSFEVAKTSLNRLLFQYGIIAIHGGYMEPRHFEMLRNKFNRYLVEGKSFAIYRVDAPYKPWTRKGTGKALGGGKGSIDHYRF